MSAIKQQYVILDTRQIVGNCAMFWRPDGAGYTCDLNDAGLYEKKKGRRETDIYVPIEVARSMAVAHVRVEPLKRAGYWSKPQPKDTRPQRCEGCSRFVKRGGWLCAKCASSPLSSSLSYSRFEQTIARLFRDDLKSGAMNGSELWSALANVTWRHGDSEVGYSFRAAGDLIAALVENGDYMDWYCSGDDGYVSDRIADAMSKEGWTYKECDFK